MTANKKKTVIIFGAGPAGLTAAYELLQQKDIMPIIIEKESHIGGLCANGKVGENLADIGGHRFFTKFSQVMDWWRQFLPLDKPNSIKSFVTVNRVTHIYYRRHFFDYPVAINLNTMRGLGIIRLCKIVVSYVHAKLKPIKPEVSASDFLTNTFGKELYETFFKDYTEKLWGISCNEISAEWGRERIRGIHLREIILSLRKIFIPQKADTFIYPRLGPEQLWQKVANKILSKGGKIIYNTEVIKLKKNGKSIVAAIVKNLDGSLQTFYADYFISTLPVKNLITAIPNVPDKVRKIADGLQYRNFRSAVLLLSKVKNPRVLADTWIYVQERDVKMGRIQVYNNWSIDLLKDKTKILLGLEYFCGDDDDIWNIPAEDFAKLAAAEAEKIGLIKAADVLEANSFKFAKAYPAYFGSYKNFAIIKNYTDKISNLYLIGRNGMHKYINMDHTVLSGMAVAENIIKNMPNKSNIWNVDNDKYLD